MAVSRTYISLLAALVLFVAEIRCYKPVIIVHGILDHASDMKDLAGFITEAHPGTNVSLIDLFEEVGSLKPLWLQVSAMTERMRPIMQSARDGVHVIGFSQGGLTVRAIIETMNDHNVDTFIALSSPLMGQYGATSYLKPFLPPSATKDLYALLYTEEFQNILSLANYWNDPHHEVENLEFNIFLPVLNNNIKSSFYNSSESELYKSNFLRINNLVLIGGPDDGVITPWQSSQFGFFNANMSIVDMTSQQVYVEDTFGLRTLSKRGAIHKYNFTGVEHIHWHGTKKVFDEAIEPWLT